MDKSHNKVKNFLLTLLLIVTFLLVVFMVLTRIQGNIPELFGFQILRISSGSMSPELEVGDVILSKRVNDVNDLKTGDIISYKGLSGSYADKTITHEVVVAPYEQDGTVYLKTAGIANDYLDPEISEEQVIGKMICRLPFLSAVYSFFMTPWGLIIVLAFLAVLFVSEIFKLIDLVKGKPQESNELYRSHRSC